VKQWAEAGIHPETGPGSPVVTGAAVAAMLTKLDSLDLDSVTEVTTLVDALLNPGLARGVNVKLVEACRDLQVNSRADVHAATTHFDAILASMKEEAAWQRLSAAAQRVLEEGCREKILSRRNGIERDLVQHQSRVLASMSEAISVEVARLAATISFTNDSDVKSARAALKRRQEALVADLSLGGCLDDSQKS